MELSSVGKIPDSDWAETRTHSTAACQNLASEPRLRYERYNRYRRYSSAMQPLLFSSEIPRGRLQIAEQSVSLDRIWSMKWNARPVSW